MPVLVNVAEPLTPEQVQASQLYVRDRFRRGQIVVGQDASQSMFHSPAYQIAATASMAISVYHGYKRNRSVGWALWWGLMGGLFPVVTPVIAVAQGFGKRK